MNEIDDLLAKKTLILVAQHNHLNAYYYRYNTYDEIDIYEIFVSMEKCRSYIENNRCSDEIVKSTNAVIDEVRQNLNEKNISWYEN